MCTAIALDGLFGRNLDLEYGYGQQVVITPRNFSFHFRNNKALASHYGMIGTAAVEAGCPLYFDAINEKGLCIAGLDFPDNAYYPPVSEDKAYIAPFELIPWVLGQCASAAEAVTLIKNTHLADIPFSEQLPQAPLHWMLADRKQCIVLEPMKDGMKIYENPVGVLCNNPPFPYHLQHLAGFQHLSAGDPHSGFEGLELKPYGGGMGAIGLPGDFSSPSRFVKAAFVRHHSRCAEDDRVTQFFHLLDAVAMPQGAIRVRGGQDEITRYSCCCDMETGDYYFTTYENRRVQRVHLAHCNLDSMKLQCYPQSTRQDICSLN